MRHITSSHQDSSDSHAIVGTISIPYALIPADIGGIICYCESCPHFGRDEQSYCFLRPGGQCFSAIEEVYNAETRTLEPQRTFGCFSDSQQALLQCKGDLVQSYYGRSIQCCNFTDLCNKDLLPTYTPRETSSIVNKLLGNRVFVIALLVLVLLCLSILFSILPVRKWFVFLQGSFFPRDSELSISFANFRRFAKLSSMKIFSGRNPYGRKMHKSQHILQDSTNTTGSGVGKPLLVRNR